MTTWRWGNDWVSQACIFDHVRTPLAATAGGALQTVPAVELATQVLVALGARSVLDTAGVDDVVVGIAGPGEDDATLARAALLNAGFSQATPGLQLSRHLMSGLDAINTGAAHIMAGQSTVVIAAGVESQLRGRLDALDSLQGGDPAIAYRTFQVTAGIGADLLATRRGYGRRELEHYALESHRRAAHAWSERRFARSIVAAVDDIGRPLLERDELIRHDLRHPDLECLEPAFASDGEKCGYDAIALMRYPELEFISHVHTAGTSAVAADGAAALLLASAEVGRQSGWRPRARVRGFASCGAEPTIGLTAAAPASLRALKNAGMSASDIELFQVDETFAAPVLDYMDELHIAHDVINVNGGALALGQPLGAMGIVMLGMALDELERSGKGTALIALGGAGMGAATIIERV